MMSRFARLLAIAGVFSITGCAELMPMEETASFFVDRSLENIRVGDYEMAMNNVQKALAVEPNHPAALLNLGVIHQRTGRPVEAADAYRAAIAADIRGEFPALTSDPIALGHTYGTIATQNLAQLPQ